MATASMARLTNRTFYRSIGFTCPALSPGLDFETKLFAKPDAPALLEKELRKSGYEITPIPVLIRAPDGRAAATNRVPIQTRLTAKLSPGGA